jgi:surface protein
MSITITIPKNRSLWSGTDYGTYASLEITFSDNKPFQLIGKNSFPPDGFLNGKTYEIKLPPKLPSILSGSFTLKVNKIFGRDDDVTISRIIIKDDNKKTVTDINNGFIQISSSTNLKYPPYVYNPPKVDCKYTWDDNSWSKCSKECGGGTQTRDPKIDTHGAHGGKPCPEKQSRVCNTQNCPVDCKYTWDDNSWSTCSKECGGGTQTREPNIVTQSAHGGKACPEKQSRVCNNEPCTPVDCQVTWSGWSDCDEDGNRSRTITNKTGPQHGGATCPPSLQKKRCPPVNCDVGDWGSWSACDKDCGVGNQYRTRIPTQQALYGGSTCPPLTQKQACNRDPCPTYLPTTPGTLYKERKPLEIEYEIPYDLPSEGITVDLPLEFHFSMERDEDEYNVDWGDGSGITRNSLSHTYTNAGTYTIRVYGQVSKILYRDREMDMRMSDFGFRDRDRDYLFDRRNINDKIKEAIENERPTYNNNNKYVKRVLTYGDNEINKLCFQGCINLLEVPALPSTITDCSKMFYGCYYFNQDLSSWDVSKVENMKQMFYKCYNFNNGDYPGGSNRPLNNWNVGNVENMNEMFFYCIAFNQDLSSWNIGKVTDTDNIFNQRNYRYKDEIGVKGTNKDCIMSEWTGWNKCSTTCGGGTQNNYRVPLQKQQAMGATCPPDVLQERECNTQPCPIDCIMDDWSWGECSKPCGGGYQSATRAVRTHPQHGATCPPSTTQRPCNTRECPIILEFKSGTDIEGIKEKIRGNTAGYYIQGRYYIGKDRQEVYYDFDFKILENGPSTQLAVYVTKLRLSVTDKPLINLEGLNGLTKVLDYGTNKFIKIILKNCTDLIEVPSLPSSITDCSEMFFGCTSFNQNINDWDVSNVTSMIYMFTNCTSFNQPLSNWNVTKVNYMQRMFGGCTSFNQPLSNWERPAGSPNGSSTLGNVYNMDYMFANCTSFNQNINNWQVGNVGVFQFMFWNCSSLCQPFDNWKPHVNSDISADWYAYWGMFKDAATLQPECKRGNNKILYIKHHDEDSGGHINYNKFYTDYLNKYK